MLISCLPQQVIFDIANPLAVLDIYTNIDTTTSFLFFNVQLHFLLNSFTSGEPTERLIADSNVHHYMAQYKYKHDRRVRVLDPTLHFCLGFKSCLPKDDLIDIGTETSAPPPANKFVVGNTFPNSCNVISNVDPSSKLCCGYDCTKQEAKNSNFVCVPIEVLQELLSRFFPVNSACTVLDFSPLLSRMGEAALSHGMKYVAISGSQTVVDKYPALLFNM